MPENENGPGQNQDLPQRQSRNNERAIQRRRLMDARTWCQDSTLGNVRYRYRIKEGLQLGTLHPSIEKTVLEIAYGQPNQIDKRLLDAIGTAGAGLITLLLRKPLTEDPLATAKVIEHGPQAAEAPALAAQESIIPPSKPRKPKGSGPPLRPGEEILP